VAIDHQAATEPPFRFFDKMTEGGVIGVVNAGDATFRFGKEQFAAIDLGARGDHAGDGSQSGADPGGIDVGEGR